MALFNLSSPWMIYYREVCEMFKNDHEIHVVYKDDENKICVYVDNINKAEAIAQLMPDRVEYGNVTITIDVIPANGEVKMLSAGQLNIVRLFETAFHGNSVLSFVKQITGIMTNNITYVVFKHEIVQYFNDDLGDIYGQCSTLYQDIASRIFKNIEGVFYCTDKENSLYINANKVNLATCCSIHA